jgi:hypothetical protein
VHPKFTRLIFLTRKNKQERKGTTMSDSDDWVDVGDSVSAPPVVGTRAAADNDNGDASSAPGEPAACVAAVEMPTDDASPFEADDEATEVQPQATEAPSAEIPVAAPVSTCGK